MAHGITARDQVVLAGKPAWHGLGIVTETAPSVWEAFRLAGLGWAVEEAPLYYEHGGQYVSLDDNKVTIRSDTRKPLGVVSDGYEVFQNEELAQLMEEAGVSQVESMGSLKGGRIVFGLARTGSFGVGRGDGDEVRQYALFGNRHDGTGAVLACATNIRVVCANTERAARDESKVKGGGLRVIHKSGMRDNIARMRETLEHIAQGNVRMAEESKALALRELSGREVSDYFADVYAGIEGPIPETPETEAQAKAKEKARKTVGKWLANMDDPRQRVAGIEGTAWAALNSVTQWADHDRRTRRTTQGETRAEASAYAALFGQACQVKQVARSRALELVG